MLAYLFFHKYFFPYARDITLDGDLRGETSALVPAAQLDQLIFLEGEQTIAVHGDELLLDLVTEALGLEPVLHLAGRRLLVDEHLGSSQNVQVPLLPPLGQNVLQFFLHHV